MISTKYTRAFSPMIYLSYMSFPVLSYARAQHHWLARGSGASFHGETDFS